MLRHFQPIHPVTLLDLHYEYGEFQYYPYDIQRVDIQIGFPHLADPITGNDSPPFTPSYPSEDELGPNEEIPLDN